MHRLLLVRCSVPRRPDNTENRKVIRDRADTKQLYCAVPGDGRNAGSPPLLLCGTVCEVDMQRNVGALLFCFDGMGTLIRPAVVWDCVWR